MFTRTTLASLAAVTLGLSVAAAAPASADHGGSDGVRAHGGCDGRAVWHLKAKPDDGRIEIEAEVDSNHRGQVWHWSLRHQGDLTATGAGTTHGASGSFTVERRTADRAGKDRLTFRAVRRDTGAVCRGSLLL
jgi:hypothetical protein